MCLVSLFTEVIFKFPITLAIDYIKVLQNTFSVELPVSTGRKGKNWVMSVYEMSQNLKNKKNKKQNEQ